MPHLKRLAAQVILPSPSRKARFAASASAGPHRKRESIPAVVLIRDFLHHAETASEARRILSQRNILIDRRPVTDYNFPVGLMDNVEIPNSQERYRVLPFYGKGLGVLAIKEEEAKFKLGKIIRKNHVKRSDIQLTLHDGKNLRFKHDEAATQYNVGDTLRISLPDNKLIGSVKMSSGNYGLIVRGTKQGLHGKILEVQKSKGYGIQSTATIKHVAGEVTTVLEYIFVVGEEEPWISLP